jgi:IclR family pca regulon transcriptional regulator
LTPSTVHDEAQLRRVLDTTRAQGWAVVDQELEQGLRSVAAPVRAEGDRVVAAVNVSVHASRATVAEIKQRLLPPLLDAVGKISADLGSLGSAALARH